MSTILLSLLVNIYHQIKIFIFGSVLLSHVDHDLMLNVFSCFNLVYTSIPLLPTIKWRFCNYGLVLLSQSDTNVFSFFNLVYISNSLVAYNQVEILYFFHLCLLKA